MHYCQHIMIAVYFVWPPCVADADVIFILWFLLLFLFFSRLISVVAEWMSSCLPYFYTWCGLSTNLECRSEMCCTQLAVSSDVQEIQDAKMTPKIAICGPLHNFVRLYVRNEGVYRQSEKNLLNSNISSTRPHNVVNFGPLTAEIC